MGKRFAILIGAAALGAALMAVGASADFRSVGDPRGDTKCHHEREANHRPCSDSMRRNADIVKATAGHGGTRLRHTIRVVGKVQSARLAINTDSDPFRDWIVKGIERGRGRSGEVLEGGPFRGQRHRTGRARYDFHHHSVEISFTEGSIGNPRHYGWSVYASAGRSAGHSVDYVPKLRGGHYIRYIGHRLG